MDADHNDERRQVFRVCVAGALFNLDIGDYPEAELLDANSEGIGVIIPRDCSTPAIGEILPISFEYRNRLFRGKMVVRNLIPRPDGSIRCGLQTLSNELSLRRGLRALAIEAQRRQLRLRALRS